MRLLVSVRGPVEACAALAGGADVIDAKDPACGALGAVSAERLAAIRRTVGAARPVSAALGDARDEGTVAAAAAAAAGAALGEPGFGGVTSAARAPRLARAARARGGVVRGAGRKSVGSGLRHRARGRCRARRRAGRRMRRGPEGPRVSGAGRGPTAPGPRGAPPYAPARGPRVTPRRAGPDRPPSR